MDSTNHKRLDADARASRDVFHARMQLQGMVKLYNVTIFFIAATQFAIRLRTSAYALQSLGGSCQSSEMAILLN